MKLPERTNEATGVYAKQCVELAKELGLPSINLWSKMQETEGWQKKFLRSVEIWRFFVSCKTSSGRYIEIDAVQNPRYSLSLFSDH